jgi:hypothetical protein
MTQTIFPYRTAPPEAVQAARWFSMQPDGTRVPIDGHLADFDAATALKLVREVRVDTDLVRSKCELQSDDRLAVVAHWHSLRTELRGIGKAADLTSENEVELSVEIPQGRSGGTLVLRTCVILAAASGRRFPFAAAKAGSIVWQDRSDVVLEGSGPRFPIEIRKFDPPYLSGMGWMLDWRPASPEVMFMGSVRLLLSERHKAVVEAAKSLNRDGTQKAILSAINVDVARSLISGMLRNPEFVQGGIQFEKGTVGQVVGDLIASAFPGEDLKTVSSQLESEPETFAARLQSRFKLFA